MSRDPTEGVPRALDAGARSVLGSDLPVIDDGVDGRAPPVRTVVGSIERLPATRKPDSESRSSRCRHQSIELSNTDGLHRQRCLDGHASTDIRRGEPGRGLPTQTRPLDASTWGAFAELVERNNEVYGGCWCIAHHSEYQRGVSDPRTLKEELVRAGRAHAALVFDEDDLAQGWCQYGSPEELGLKHHREYAKNPPPRARWRIACIFVDKGHRRPRSRRGPAGGRDRPDRSPPAAESRRGDRPSVTAWTGGSRSGSCSARPRELFEQLRVRPSGTAGRQARVDRESARSTPRSGHRDSC